MKKTILSFISALVLLLNGCTPPPETYPFAENQDIMCVELLYHASPQGTVMLNDFTLIRELEQEEIAPFMDAVRSLETEKCFSSPNRDFGNYVACVTYTDGSREVFGNYHIEFVENGETESGVGRYYFSGNAFVELFNDYAGDYSFLENE